jgi:hypothetical protein
LLFFASIEQSHSSRGIQIGLGRLGQSRHGHVEAAIASVSRFLTA